MHLRTAIVIREHESNYPDPVRFEPGDMLEIGEEDTEFPGWVRIRDRIGNEGWAPIEYIQQFESSSTGIALKPYSAKELDVEPGDRLVIKYVHCQWSWVEHPVKGSGWVPDECLNVID